MNTFFAHAQCQTLLKSTELATIPVETINLALSILLTHIVGRVALTPPKEALE